MTERPADATRPLPRGLLWLVAAGLFFGGVTAVRILSPVLDPDRPRAIGDGRTVESYEFDLSSLRIPREEISSSGLARDALPALSFPRLWSAATVDSMRRASRRTKYLVPDDLVLSVTLGGRTRAYPLRVLDWHEVLNDTLGGTPIVVIHSPLAGLSTVFERSDSSRTEFRVSGLLHASTLLFYDVADDVAHDVAADPSLWSPLQGRAVAGPASARGESLRVVASSVLPWSRWEKLFPEGEVLRPEAEYEPRYDRAPYGSYLGDDRLRFPVTALPPRDRLAYKTSLLALEANGVTRLCTIESLIQSADADGRARITVGGSELTFLVEADPACAWFDPSVGRAGNATARRVYWFAWYATHPGTVEPS